jgi:hypothetical protein
MIWLGNGFYVGVPARNLSAEEVKRYGREFLLSLGIYADIDPPKPKKAEEPEPEPIEADDIEEDEQWQE